MKYSRTLPFFVTFLLTSQSALYAAEHSETVNIGSRREMFVDNALIEKFAGKAEQRLHYPIPQEIAIKHDAP